MRRVGPDTVEAALTGAGCTVEHRFGISCITSRVADDDLERDPAFHRRLEELELELALCDREPSWRTARFRQLTARRG